MKSVIYFEGGGWCSGHDNTSVLESCYDRSSTDLGSSKNWPLQDSSYDYVFRADPAQDQFFSNWNRFIIKYCDGGRHQSYQDKPIVVNGKKLFFRGRMNVFSILNFVEKMAPVELSSEFVV